MKKQLSFALLTISIFTLNTLPVQAINITSAAEITEEQDDANNSAINDGQWCVAIPYMGLFCWDL